MASPLRTWAVTKTLRSSKYLTNLRLFSDLRDLRGFRYPSYFGYLKSLKVLSNLLFTQDVTGKALDQLPKADLGEGVDLLSILLGRTLERTLQIAEKDKPTEYEVRTIVKQLYPTFTTTGDELVNEAKLDILRYLPARSVIEIRYVLSLAENISDQQIQQACTLALRYAEPETEDAWTALEKGKVSQKETVREAVEEGINRQRNALHLYSPL